MIPPKASRSPEYYERLSRRRNPDHWPDCECNQCWSTPISCIQCKNEFRSVRSLRGHLHSLHSGKLTNRERRAAAARQVLVPDGLGYLQRVMASPAQISKFNLSAISRFADVLATKKINGAHKSPRLTRLHRSTLKHFENAAEASSVDTPLSAEATLAIYRMACATGISPAFVASALVAYGLEYLSRELKKHPVAPSHSVTPVPIKKEAVNNGNVRCDTQKSDTAEPAKSNAKTRGIF